MRVRLAPLVLLAAAVASACAGQRPDVACPPAAAVALVETRERRLVLCDGGKRVGTFPVALGRGGTGKRVQGDGKTPLGAYALGAPRPSRGFGTFIPIAYPTEVQRRSGYTGTAVGIHGPARRMRWAGRANTWLDWTAGCVAVASDEDAGAVAAFVRARRPAVVIR